MENEVNERYFYFSKYLKSERSDHVDYVWFQNPKPFTYSDELCICGHDVDVISLESQIRVRYVTCSTNNYIVET